MLSTAGINLWSKCYSWPMVGLPIEMSSTGRSAKCSSPTAGMLLACKCFGSGRTACHQTKSKINPLGEMISFYLRLGQTGLGDFFDMAMIGTAASTQNIYML